MLDLSFFHGPNAGYVLGLYEQFLADPSSVDASWQGYFESFSPEEAAPRAEAEAAASAAAASAAVDVPTIVGAHELAEAIRAHGHTAA